MKITEDRWLGNLLTYPVFKVDAQQVDIFEIERHLTENSDAMYFCKVNTSESRTVLKLTSAGFYIVDTNVSFTRDTSPARLAVDTKCVIRPFKKSDESEILKIAYESFVYSRFHLDPLIDREAANRIKKEWIQSYIDKKRGDVLAVGTIEDRPVGFMGLLSNNTAKVFDLMAVDKQFRRFKIGHSLVAFLIDEYRNSCDRFEIGTQISNIPSIRLFENHGFTTHASQYILHMHIRKGTRCELGSLIHAKEF